MENRERLAAIRVIGELFVEYNGKLIINSKMIYFLGIFDEIKFLCMVKPEDGLSRWTEARLELAATICKHRFPQSRVALVKAYSRFITSIFF